MKTEVKGSSGVVKCTKCSWRMLVIFNAPDMSPESNLWPENCGEKVIKLEGQFDKQLREIILCKMCGDDTTMLSTKLCNNCWELDEGWRWLIQQDKSKAREWLQERMRCMEGKHQYGDEPDCGICGDLKYE